MILDPRVAPLAAWFADLQRQAIAAVGAAVDDVCIEGLSRVEELLAAVRASGGGADLAADQLGWRAALEQEIRPVTRAVQEAMRSAEARFTAHTATAPLRQRARDHLGALPESLTLGLDPSESTSERIAAAAATPAVAPPSLALPLRRWFDVTLRVDLEAIFDELDAQIGAALAAGHAELARIETVLDYHLFIVDESRDVAARDESARIGLDHAIRLVQAQAAELDRLRDLALRHFLAAASSRMDDALAPLRVHRPDEVLRALAARDAREHPGPLRAWTRRVAASLRELEARAVPFARELLAELGDEAPRVGHWDLIIHGRRLRDDDPPPELYRRLFGDIPLGVADLYQPRPDLEAPCRAAFAAWVEGRHASLLVVGDRGAGKRTLVNRVRAEIRADVPVHWLALGPHITGERGLARALAEALDAAPVDRLVDLPRAIRGPARRQVVILEHLEFAFARTPAGVDALRGFTELLHATEGPLLWVALVSAPALALLDTCLQLSRRFTHVVRVGAASRAFLERVVRSRHRASGFGLRFEAPIRQPIQRLRRRINRRDEEPESGDEWFADLRRIAGANPSQALRYWLLAASLDPRTRHDLIVRPLPRRHGPILAALTLEQRLILAALIQHGGLDQGRLVEVLGLSVDVVRPEVEDLQHRALVNSSGAGFLEVPAPAWLPVATDLRSRNIL